MSYDFDEAPDRRGTLSVKWDSAEDGTLPLWVADMDFPSPQPVIDALQRRVGHGVFGYPLPTDAYFESYIEWAERALGLRIRREWVLHCRSVMPAVKAAILSLTRPGDGVVVQPPVYFPFYGAISANGRRIVRNPLREESGRYTMDLDQLEDVIDDSTRLLILCSPHNPVGRVWTADELATLAEVCLRHRLIVVSDEIHCGIVFDGRSFFSYAQISDDAANACIVCQSPTKTFNLAGLPSAQITVPNGEIRRQFKNRVSALGHYSAGVLDLLAAETAYREGEEWRGALLRYLEGNRRWLDRFVQQELPGVQMVDLEGTFVPWLDFREYQGREGIDDPALTKRIREGAHVWLHAGSEFGSEGRGFQRVNIACGRGILEEAMSQIRAELYEGVEK